MVRRLATGALGMKDLALPATTLPRQVGKKHKSAGSFAPPACRNKYGIQGGRVTAIGYTFKPYFLMRSYIVGRLMPSRSAAWVTLPPA